MASTKMYDYYFVPQKSSSEEDLRNAHYHVCRSVARISSTLLPLPASLPQLRKTGFDP